MPALKMPRPSVPLCLWFAMAVAACLQAGPGQLRFERLSVKDGLLGVRVLSILQDQKGFIWIATQDGLNRFDGYSFLPYKTDPNNPNSLLENYTYAMIEDRAGNLWLGTTGGLNKFEPATRNFTAFQHDKDNPQSLSNNDINALYEDSEGRIWIGTRDGLNVLDPATGKCKRYRHDPNDPTSLPDKEIWKIYRDRRNIFWIGTGKGLSKWDPATDRFQTYLIDPTGLAAGKIKAILEDKYGTFWIGSERGLLKMDRTAGSFVQYQANPDDPDSISDNKVITLLEDPHDNFWIGTENGLNRMDRKTGRFTSYHNNPADPNSLSHNRVRCLYHDQTGTLWIGTWAGGINQLNHITEQFTDLPVGPTTPESPGNHEVSAVYQTKQGERWVGRWKEGLSRINAADNTIIKIYKADPKQENALTGNEITTIREDDAGFIWVGTWGKGVNRLDPRTDTFQVFKHQTGDSASLPGDFVATIYEDRSGTVWVGSDEGLARYNGLTGDFLTYSNRNDDSNSLSNNHVETILEDQYGLLWIGTQEGLNVLARDGRPTITSYTQIKGDPQSLSNNWVSYLHEDKGNNLWVGTHGGGLNKVLRDGPNVIGFQSYSIENGLATDVIMGILEDDGGCLWLSTNQGITKFDPREERFINYNDRDGVQGSGYVMGSCFKTAGNHFLFGGNKGLTGFYPKNVKINKHAPKTVLTDFLLFNKPAPLQREDSASPLKSTIDATQHMVLNHKNYVLAFEFSALHFVDPSRNSYAYKLEGFDTDWMETGANKRFASYTNLAGGDYTFRVKSYNKDGVESETETAVSFEVLPPPWKTWWAYTLYALAISAVITYYVFSQKAKLAYERSVVQRLRQLDKLKDEFLANTSHELRTPLNGIIGLAESLMDGAAGAMTEKAKFNLSMIVFSGKRLANLVNDILDFSNMRRKDLKLRKKSINFRELTDVVLALSKPLVGKKNIQLANATPHDLPPISADEDRLQQIMHNLVGNAIKFTEAGQVWVEAEVEGDHLIARVKDTGIGIPEDKFESIFESFEQVDGSTERKHAGTGLGLAVTRKLVELHAGKIWVSSQLKQGSTFSFSIPLSDRPAEKDADTGRIAAELRHHEPSEITESASPDADAVPNEGQFNILVVDDEMINRQVVANYLSMDHLNIFEADSGPTALASVAGTHHLDMVLLDIMMPDMSGYEVCEKIRLKYNVSELPILFLTAKDQTEDLVKGFDAGANDYITKPIAKSELLSRVRTHLQLLDINRKLEDYSRTLEEKVEERTKELNYKNIQLEERNVELGGKNRELETLDDIVKTINREVELERVLKSLLKQAMHLFPRAEQGMFLLREPWGGSFKLGATQGHTYSRLKDLTFSHDELINRYTDHDAQIQQGVYLIRRGEHQKEAQKWRDLPRTAATLSMTVTLDNQLQGLLVLDNFESPEAFEDSDLRKLDRFREHAVSAIAKAGLLQELSEKNEQIVSSIRYAERIQNAILPRPEMVREYLPDTQILFLPKDIVSGDFYWFSCQGDSLFIAAVDCTGHGVPGALMSVIGTTLLNQIVKEKGIDDPAAILEHLHMGVREVLKQEEMQGGRVDTTDGMDMALCKLTQNADQLVFAGAKRPLYLVRQSQGPKRRMELQVIKGDRHAIGGRQKEDRRQFTNHQVPIQTGDLIYLTSDGFADQPDPKGKKYGSRRLKDFLQNQVQGDSEARQSIILNELLSHRGQEPQRDDITIVGFRIP